MHQGGAISFDIASNDLDVNGDDELSEIDFHLELTNQDGTRIEKNDDGSANHTNDDGLTDLNLMVQRADWIHY